jgi:4-oxalomesaconate tautomerase
MLMRGGTSKGLYFLKDELPDDVAERDSLLLRLMGSPDARQIDGLGGAHSLTSKVAVISAGEREGDVDYLFLQLGVDKAMVSDRQNCGNLLAGVGPFAIERGLVAAEGDEARIGIFMLNTNSRVVATVPLRDGVPIYSGNAAISGVPGTAVEIRLDFDDLEGSSCGALLPTGNVVDVIHGVECTLVDNGMPTVVMRAEDVGASGYETIAELEANSALRERVEAIRLAAGPMMNLGDVTNTTVPKMTLVAPPSGEGDISTRSFIPHTPHDAIGVLAAVSVATAVALPGSPGASVLRRPRTPGTIVIEHPTGAFEAAVDVSVAADGSVKLGRAGIIRTARKLMDGMSFPRETL